MKIDVRFPRQIALTLIGVFALGAYPLSRFGTPDVIFAAVLGALLSTANVIFGFLAIEYSFDKSYTVFLKAVLGGMGIRMLFLLGAMLVLILAFHVDAVALTISLLGFYMIYLILEILFIQKKVMLRNQT